MDNEPSPILTPVDELLLSADSHVVEPEDLWDHHLIPAQLRALPPRPQWKSNRPGATEARERPAAMAKDGVSAEILYPTLALHLFAAEDRLAQQAAFHLYNEWVADYRRVAPDRLFAVGCLPAHDIDEAVSELERCRELGLHGGMIWQSPPSSLPLQSAHYEPLWDAAAATATPLSFHVLTGFPPTVRSPGLPAWDRLMRRSVAEKLSSAVEVLYVLIFHGILLRHPGLRIVLAENQIGWIPWLLQQWDQYSQRFQERLPLPEGVRPSDLFQRQVFCTFQTDDQGCAALRAGWGLGNCLWASDFPHGGTSWPDSRRKVAEALSLVPPEGRARLLRENAVDLYGLTMPSAPADSPVPPR